MKEVVTGIDFFADHDDEHAAASVKRIAGGYFRVHIFGEQLQSDPKTGVIIRENDFKTIAEAKKFARKITGMVDVDSTLMAPTAVHAAAQIFTEQTKNRELQDQLDNMQKTLDKNAAERRRLEEALIAKGG